jgi:hypothetical protein
MVAYAAAMRTLTNGVAWLAVAVACLACGSATKGTPCGGSGKSCCNETACNNGLTCSAGTCSVAEQDSGNNGNDTPCNTQSDCPAPLACASDYRCRSLCTTNADCNVLGTSGLVCAKDANGVSYRANSTDVTNGMINAAGATTDASPDGSG